MSGAWIPAPDIARVEGERRRALLNLARMTQPAVLLEGAALLIHDMVDGSLTTDEIIGELRAEFPDVPYLPEQVRECLDQLAAAGIITALRTPHRPESPAP